MRAACKALDTLSPEAPDAALLEAMRAAAAVWYNHSGAVECFFNEGTAEVSLRAAVVQALRVRGSDFNVGVAQHFSSPRTMMGSVQSAYRRANRSGPNVDGQPREGAFGITPKIGTRQEHSVFEVGTCLGDWDYQWCTEMVQPFSSDGKNDM